MSAPPWFGQRTPEYDSLDIMSVPGPGSGGINVIAGGGTPNEVLVSRPGRERYLVLQTTVGSDWRYVPGDYVPRLNFQGDDTGGAEEDLLVFGAPHNLTTGDGPYKLTQGTTLPSGLDETTLYFVRVVNATTITLHLSREDAINNVSRVDLVDDGTGDNDLGGMPPGAAATTTDGYNSLLINLTFSDAVLIIVAAPDKFTVSSPTGANRLTYWFIP